MIRAWLAVAALCATLPAARAEARLIVARAPLAGAQYHALAQVREHVRVGDPLQLVRESGNRHDRRAIRVEWHGHLLGYVPRADNAALAAALDDGAELGARIHRLSDDADPWRRLEFEVFLRL